jgi:hypothetical protein
MEDVYLQYKERELALLPRVPFVLTSQVQYYEFVPEYKDAIV